MIKLSFTQGVYPICKRVGCIQFSLLPGSWPRYHEVTLSVRLAGLASLHSLGLPSPHQAVLGADLFYDRSPRWKHFPCRH